MSTNFKTQRELLFEYLKEGYKITHRKGLDGFYLGDQWVAFSDTRAVIKQLRDAGVNVQFKKNSREKVWFLLPDDQQKLVKKVVGGRIKYTVNNTTLNKMNDNLKIVALKQLEPSKSNPRKEINEESLQELSESIQRHGVLQPIIVREHPEYMEEEMYEVICGERRYRASVMAGLESIPAMVKDLSDDEAFEVQIIENLERKDVHPLHEAEAFQKMLDSGRYSIADIAAKVAKSETFVAQRLKLNDLIDPIKEDFYKGELGIGHAVLLARLSQEDQQEFYEQEIEGEWGDGYGTVSCLREILSRDDYDLDKATFDMNDASLIPEAGACIKCAKCSLANPTLFPDIQENLCYDKTCFRAKTEAALLNQVKSILENGEDVYFLTALGGKPSQEITNLLEEYKVKTLSYSNDFYYDENSNIKGIYVDKINTGKVINISISASNKSSATSSQDEVVNDPAQDLKSQIDQLEDRAKRALELDREKVHKRMLDEEGLLEGVIQQEEEDYRWRHELAPFFVALAESDYKFRQWLEKEYDLDLGYSDIDGYHKLKGLAKKNDLGKVMRAFVLFSLPKQSILDHGRYPTAAAVYDLVRAFAPLLIEVFETEQQEIANKRIERSEKKLAELKTELVQLESENANTE